uniref:Uncharacterized protein n=1 Tax=Glossina austeni TaxID=7395 RepID=A0A1A9UML0_GLOAU
MTSNAANRAHIDVCSHPYITSARLCDVWSTALNMSGFLVASSVEMSEAKTVIVFISILLAKFSIEASNSCNFSVLPLWESYSCNSRSQSSSVSLMAGLEVLFRASYAGLMVSSRELRLPTGPRTRLSHSHSRSLSFLSLEMMLPRRPPLFSRIQKRSSAPSRSRKRKDSSVSSEKPIDFYAEERKGSLVFDELKARATLLSSTALLGAVKDGGGWLKFKELSTPDIGILIGGPSIRGGPPIGGAIENWLGTIGNIGGGPPLSSSKLQAKKYLFEN